MDPIQFRVKSFAKRLPGSGAAQHKLARFSTKVGSSATSPVSTAQAKGPIPEELRRLFLSKIASPTYPWKIATKTPKTHGFLQESVLGVEGSLGLSSQGMWAKSLMDSKPIFERNDYQTI